MGERNHTDSLEPCVWGEGGVGVMGGEMEAPRLTLGLYFDLLDIVH